MNIIIHRGRNQIGGNIIEISTYKTRVLLDVGLDLDEEKNKVLPEIKGLFDEAGYDAVFVSHYHGDHLGLAYQIHKDIPLYIGAKSAKIIQTSDAFRGVATITPHGFLEHKKKINVGDIAVTPYLCDHSAFDSYMLLCEGNGERILYTGDFRSNGRKPYDWILSELPTEVDKLVCEGTTLSREGYVAVSEQELEEEAVKEFRNTEGPIFVLQSSTNIDRIVTMYRAAKRCGRKFLQEVYMAEITSAVGGSIPNPLFRDVYAFITGPGHHERLTKYRRMGKERMAQTPFVMCVRSTMLSYLKSLSEKMSFRGGVLVYSMWNGYRKQPGMDRFLRECEKMGIKIITLHTSGHADEIGIQKLIDRVRPKEIIPVHTENGGWFREKYPTLVQKGERLC